MDYQNIFNRDFYPTPQEVIDKMMMGEDVSDKIVLEPSAGKGDIVKWLVKNGARCVLACEINDTLRRSLTDCDVIGSDFLALVPEQVSACDYIVMNPPFLQGMKHLKHACDIAPGGCTIVCILPHSRFASDDYDDEDAGAPWINEEYAQATFSRRKEIYDDWVRNHIDEYVAYTEKRKKSRARHSKFMETIDLEGYHENIGNVFSQNAERCHDYDIELVKIYKPKVGNDEWAGYVFDSIDTDAYGGQEGLLPHNDVYELVSRYIDAVNQFDKVEELSKKINETVSTFSRFDIKFGARGTDGENKLSNITRDRYKKELQKAAWRKVIDIFKLNKYATSKLREQINKFVETQTHIPFTMSNIYKMANMIVQTHGQRMEAAISEAFDHICSFAPENYDLDQNLRANNKDAWKTNSDYMVNKKFIVPGIAKCDERYGSQPYVDIYCGYGYYSSADKIADVLKALAYISGKPISECDMNDGYSFDNFISKKQIPWGVWCECGWFRMKFYKKGTMHFEFIGEEGERIWQLFNQTAAKHKGWRIGNQTTSPKKPKHKESSSSSATQAAASTSAAAPSASSDSAAMGAASATSAAAGAITSVSGDTSPDIDNTELDDIFSDWDAA